MPLAVLATIQTGGYVNPFKALAIIIMLLIWVRLLAWMDKDAPIARLPREAINAGMMAGLVIGYALFFLLPGFLIGFAALFGLFVVDIATYLIIRQRVVGLADLKKDFKVWINDLLKSKKKKTVTAAAGQVLIIDKSGNPQSPPEDETPERPQYDAAQRLLTNPMKFGAERLDLTAGEPASVQYFVDGVRYDGEALDRNTAGSAVQYLKRVAGLDLNERRKPQTGDFRANFDGQKRQVQITTYGSTAGESARMVTDPKTRQSFKMADVGFSESQLELLKKSIADGSGVVLLSAPKAQGLTSLAYSIIRAHDAFMFHVQTIERGPELDLEGITQNALPANASAAEELKQVSWVVSQEPDAIMITSIEDPKSAKTLAAYAGENKRAYICLRAPSTFEAIRQWRKLVGDDALAMKSLTMAISGRLVRRLCSACKVGYTPDPMQLRKLNMSPDKVGKLYAARKEPMRDAKGNPVPCTFCRDLGFKGRFGVYEIFPIDEEVRKIIIEGGSDAQLKQAFRKMRGRLLQEMALAQVQSGETSVEEVLRVLKGDEGTGGSGSPSAGRPTPAAPGGPPRAGGPKSSPGGPPKSIGTPKPPSSRSAAG
ncbi:MAG: Flp pilus assembly complex ATPase component TadA [Planctomycetota bacterium]|nr:Flp pilus assembly complex ATPase component TadA [Planctomycetota bacterium]